MKFNLNNALEILGRTPTLLEAMLGDLSEVWTTANEGKGTWSAYDIIGHLIHGEKTDWMPRAEIILSDNPDKRFPEFDRFAQFEESKGKTLPELLQEFKMLREKNLDSLRSKNLTPVNLAEHGIHPSFGLVSLSQLLSTWVVHDLNHLSQISRVMAKQYKEEVAMDQLPRNTSAKIIARYPILASIGYLGSSCRKTERTRFFSLKSKVFF